MQKRIKCFSFRSFTPEISNSLWTQYNSKSPSDSSSERISLSPPQRGNTRWREASRPLPCLLFSPSRTTFQGPREPRGEARAPAELGRLGKDCATSSSSVGAKMQEAATRQHSLSTLSPLSFQFQDQPKGPPAEAVKTGSSNTALDSPACPASLHSSLPSGKMRMGNLLLSCTCSVSLQKREMEGRASQPHVHHHPPRCDAGCGIKAG